MTQRPGPRWRRALRSITALPVGLRVVVLAIAVLHVVGLTWGMPASNSWDVDGVAPRDFLPGLAATYTPGSFNTYPPLHLAILAIVTLPVTLTAVLRARTMTVPDVLTEILQPSYMTAFTILARIVTVAMSLAIVIVIARIASELARPEQRRSAAVFAALAAGVGVPFTYYSHVTNLDVPCNFWAAFAALALVRAIARQEPRRLRGALVLAALAVATKDQAYAIFLLGVPLSLGAWLVADRWARRNVKALAREVAIGAAVALVVLLAIDGALTNPSGFRARLRFLGGSASQDFATYAANLGGRVRLLLDAGGAYGRHYPVAFAGLYVAGVVVAVRAGREESIEEGSSSGARIAAALVPLALSVSFTCCFNLVAMRVDERFTLSQVLLLAVYAGIALSWVYAPGARAAPVRLALQVPCALLVAWSLWRCVELDANLVLDPRYEAERYLAAHVRPEDGIETYGLNVYLPRFPPGSRVVRVGPTPPEKRGPMPGVEEVVAPFMAIEERRPRFVVVNECWSWRYIPRAFTPLAGRIIPEVQQRLAADVDGTTFFDRLFVGEMGYDLVKVFTFEHAWWRRIELHASVACPMYVLERRRPE